MIQASIIDRDDDDPFDLTRFLNAQESKYAGVLAELKSGQKRSYWMWYIFPHIIGLGHTSTAQLYAGIV